MRSFSLVIAHPISVQSMIGSLQIELGQGIPDLHQCIGRRRMIHREVFKKRTDIRSKRIGQTWTIIHTVPSMVTGILQHLNPRDYGQRIKYFPGREGEYLRRRSRNDLLKKAAGGGVECFR